MNEWTSAEADELQAFHTQLVQSLYDSPSAGTLPHPGDIEVAEKSIIRHVSDGGLGIEDTIKNLQSVAKGFNQASKSPNYYGFVIGGATRMASVADTMATIYDQNVHVHLPSETIATTLESHTLRMLCELLNFNSDIYQHRTFTTGATASNVLGLACGRDHVIAMAAARTGAKVSTGTDGLLSAAKQAEIDHIQVLTSVPHSSIGKAASIVGLGRHSVISVARKDKPHKIDMARLEDFLNRPRTASIVAISCGEVNTGFFATKHADMKRIRALCDKVGAFIHVDGAFGLMARCLNERLSTDERRIGDVGNLIEGCDGLEYADSITGDAHKLLNVPYDCGFFFSRSVGLAMEVFQNAGAAYLYTATAQDGDSFIPSPLNIGLENSRRFRALPVYASLIAYGRDGYADMLLRQIELARAVSRSIADDEHYELLPEGQHQKNDYRDTYIVVLFRAKDDNLNAELVRRINETRRIYVSGTKWEDQTAARIAVSNWQADVSRDAPLIQGVLQEVYERWESRQSS